MEKNRTFDGSSELRKSNSSTLMNAGSHALLNSTNIDAISRTYFDALSETKNGLLGARDTPKQNHLVNMTDIFRNSRLETNDNFRKMPNNLSQNGSYNKDNSQYFNQFSRENVPKNIHIPPNMVGPDQLDLLREHGRMSVEQDRFYNEKKQKIDEIEKQLLQNKVEISQHDEVDWEKWKFEQFKQRKTKISTMVGQSILDNPYIRKKYNNTDKENVDDEDMAKLKKEEDLLEKARAKEQTATLVLSHLPVNEQLYKNQLVEVEYVADQRAEQEKVYLEERLRQNYDDEQHENHTRRRDRVKNRLADALKENVIEKEKFYSVYEGFFLYFDFVLHLPRYFAKSYLTFKILKEEELTAYETVKTVEQPVVIAECDTYKRAFGDRYKIYSMEPTDGTYTMIKLWVEEIFDIEDEHEFDNLDRLPESIDEIPPPQKYKEKVIYGWSVFGLFYKENQLFGRWKLPIYKQPLYEEQFTGEMDFSKLKDLPILKFGDLYVRTDVPEANEEMDYVTVREDFKFDAEKVVQEYHTPGYHTFRLKEPEIDQYELERQAKRKRRLQRYLDAMHRKQLRDKLRERLALVKARQIADEEKYLWDEVEKERLRLQELHDKKKADLIKRREELESQLKNMSDEMRKLIMFRKDQLDNIAKITSLRKGVRLIFHRLRGISTYHQIKVVGGIFLNNDQLWDDLGDRLLCETVKHTDHIVDVRLRVSPPPTFTIEYKDEVHELLKNAEGIGLLFKGRQKVYLGIQVVYIPEKKAEQLYDENEELDEVERKLDIKREPKPDMECAGWYFTEICRNDCSIKKVSRASQKLYSGNVQKMPFRTVGIKPSKQILDYSIEVFEYDFDSLAYFAELRKKPGKKKLKFKLVKELEYTPNYAPFIPCNKRQYDNRPFLKGSGVDIYVDACRFLPDNVTFTKVVVKVIDSDIKDFIKNHGGVPDLSSDIFNPEFNFRQELRAPNFDPTLCLYIQFLTIDSKEDEKKAYILGYSIYPLFINKKTHQQPKSRSEYADSILNNGLFQLPIYCGKFERFTRTKKTFFWEDLASRDKLPGTSVLVRINLAPKSTDGTKVLSISDFPPNEWEKYGVWVKSVPYCSGMFNNDTCNVRASDYDLFDLRLKRELIESREKSKDIMASTGVYIEDEQNKSTREIDDEIFEYMDSLQEQRIDTTPLNLKYFSKYTSKAGFKFACDGLYNVPTKDFYVTYYTLNPPAHFYNPDETQQGYLKVNTRYDWNCSINLQVYNETFVKFTDIPFNPFLHFIIDVRSVKIRARDEPIVKKVGWTILPIFTHDGYVNTNVYQLPIFEGSMTKSLADQLISNDPWDTIQTMVKQKKIKYKSKITVVCRQLDAQREGHFQTPFDYESIFDDYLPKGSVKSLQYTYDESIADKKHKRLKDYIPYEEDVVSFNHKITQAANNIKKG